MLRKIMLLASLAAAGFLVACSSNARQPEQLIEEETAEWGSSESLTIEDAAKDQQETAPIADDEVVNDFIASYNAISDSPITEAEDGNIRTKFFSWSHGYYLELLHANDTGKIRVSINQTNETASAGMAGMRNIFHDVARAIDPSLTEDEVYSYFDSLLSGDAVAENPSLGSALVQFVPDAELSKGLSRGHIVLAAQ